MGVFLHEPTYKTPNRVLWSWSRAFQCCRGLFRGPCCLELLFGEIMDLCWTQHFLWSLSWRLRRYVITFPSDTFMQDVWQVLSSYRSLDWLRGRTGGTEISSAGLFISTTKDWRSFTLNIWTVWKVKAGDDYKNRKMQDQGKNKNKMFHSIW